MRSWLRLSQPSLRFVLKGLAKRTNRLRKAKSLKKTIKRQSRAYHRKKLLGDTADIPPGVASKRVTRLRDNADKFTNFIRGPRYSRSSRNWKPRKVPKGDLRRNKGIKYRTSYDSLDPVAKPLTKDSTYLEKRLALRISDLQEYAGSLLFLAQGLEVGYLPRILKSVKKIIFSKTFKELLFVSGIDGLSPRYRKNYTRALGRLCNNRGKL
jgi:hypothetical protein